MAEPIGPFPVIAGFQIVEDLAQFVDPNMISRPYRATRSDGTGSYFVKTIRLHAELAKHFADQVAFDAM